MANVARRLSQNVPGNFFVDETCIDCDACRQIAPASFRDHGDQSSVYHQPETIDEIERALMALVACPTGSIGAVDKRDVRVGIRAFPSLVAENVYFCGFTSERSYGAWSYLIVRAAEMGGNILVDSPRFAGPLVKRIAEMGGVRTMFLTHVDDIADHAQFARKFGAKRIMHADDGAQSLAVEQVIEGEDAVRLDDDLIAVPVPGHTRGHMVLLYRDKFLFTGDHLAWSPEQQILTAFRDVAWYSWKEQTRSMPKLLDHRFEWVLPGHGRIHHDTAEAMHRHLERCVSWMKSSQ
ncbi:MAG: MBL fold metallo-hydrolase [Pyrinomonadaceae bacterium]|nr:MBL fold metallo-hydrolase [Pyrinomonadaceae bacterium]